MEPVSGLSITKLQYETIYRYLRFIHSFMINFRKFTQMFVKFKIAINFQEYHSLDS